jgi:RNA-binding protein PNO1
MSAPEMMMMTSEDQDMDMSNANTTIDASVVQSRILQSASLAKEETSAMNDDNNGVTAEQPTFPQLSALAARGGKTEYRRVRCPPHRYTPLRENWEQILTPLVEFLKLQASQNAAMIEENAKQE